MTGIKSVRIINYDFFVCVQRVMVFNQQIILGFKSVKNKLQGFLLCPKSKYRFSFSCHGLRYFSTQES